ncbi:MAG TPA: hypothetical protein VIM34_03830 [Burkholderiaceae bacterium]
MKRVIKTLGWTALVGLLLAAVLVASLVAMVGPLHSTLIQINGEPVTFAHLGVGEGLVAVAGMVLALLIVLLVVPFAVLLPLAIVALVLIGVLVVALGAVAGVAALVFSPLILLAGAVWLIWRLVRNDGPKNDAKADATMPR